MAVHAFGLQPRAGESVGVIDFTENGIGNGEIKEQQEDRLGLKESEIGHRGVWHCQGGIS